jgi:hypothetical protein
VKIITASAGSKPGKFAAKDFPRIFHPRMMRWGKTPRLAGAQRAA